MDIILMNPVVGMLRNAGNGKWHPILFQEAPFPGSASDQTVMRMRSKGHHTEGFIGREDAVAGAKELASKCGAKLALERDIEWDGADVPAMNVLCTMNGDQIELLA